MNQRERSASQRPREADLEKNLRPEYKEYEEWRNAQASGTAEEPAKEKKPEPKKAPGFGRWDVLFLVLGVLAGLVYQSCKAAR